MRGFGELALPKKLISAVAVLGKPAETMSSDNGTQISKWFTVKTHSVGPYYVVHYIVEHNITTDFAAWTVENLKTTPTCKFWRQYAKVLIDAIKSNSQVVSSTDRKLLNIFLTRADKHMDKLYAIYQMRGCAPAGDAPSHSSSGTCSATDLQELVPTSKWFTIKREDNLYTVTPNITSEFDEWIAGNVDMKTWFVPSFCYQHLLNAIKNTYSFNFVLSEQLQEFLAAADKCLDELYTRYEMRGPCEAVTHSEPVPTSRWYTCKYKHALYGATPKLSSGFGEWLATNLKDELNISTPRVTCSSSQQTVRERKLFFNVEDLREFLAEVEPRMEKLYTRYRKEKASRGRVSGYTLFSIENREQVVANNPGIKFTEIGKQLVKMWYELLSKERREWNDKASALNKETNDSPPIAEQELPSSKWFTVEHGKFTYNRLRIKPNVSPEFGQWLAKNLKEELDIRIGCRKIYSKDLVKAIQHGTTCWCSFASREDTTEFITAADRCMDELYGRYKEQELPRSKWFTIEHDTANHEYNAIPKLQDKFGEWLVAKLEDELTIMTIVELPVEMVVKSPADLYCNVTAGEFVEAIKEYSILYWSNSLKRFTKMLGKLDQYLDGMHRRYEQEQELPSSKWFAIKVLIASWHHVIPIIPTEFGEWLVANCKDELDNTVQSDVPRIYLCDFLNSLKNNTWFCCSSLHNARAIISNELDPRMDKLYARYIADAQSHSSSGTCFATKSDTLSQEKEQEQQVAQPPTSKWFTITRDLYTGTYDVTPHLGSPFDQWAITNCWDLYKDHDLTYAIKSGVMWAPNTRELQEFLTNADQRIDEMYARYKNEQEPPKSKWFSITYDNKCDSYEVTPNLEHAFEQWIAANSGDLLIEAGEFTYFIKNTQCWVLDRNQLQDLLAAANPLLDELHECFLARKRPLPKSKWFTIDYDPDCTSLYIVAPYKDDDDSFAEWLVANCWDFYIRGKSPARAIKNGLMWCLSDRQLREFLSEADYRMDELYEQYIKELEVKRVEEEAMRAEEEAKRAEEDSSDDSSDSDESSDDSSYSDDTSDDSSYSDDSSESSEEDCEPWILITTAKMIRFRVKAPREFVKFCTGKTFAGVQIDWKLNGKRQIQTKPMVWRSNLADLGCGRINGKGMICDPKTFPRLQAALAEAHTAWQPDKSSDRMVIGKPTVEFDICRKELGYSIRYHPSLGRKTRLGGAELIKQAIAEALEMDDTRPKLIIE